MDRAEAAASIDRAGLLMLLEHPPTITLGHRENGENLLGDPARLAEQGIAIERTDRGGFATYHGPGQLVGYLVFPLAALGGSVPRLVAGLEDCLQRVVSGFGVTAGRDPRRPGLWVHTDKLAAIGLRLRRGVTGHGFALNIDPQMSHFENLVPCGLQDRGVTSLATLTGSAPSLTEAADRTAAAFADSFGLSLQRREPEEVFP